MPTPRAVLFDMDGVLTLTEAPHWRSWQIAAEARGVVLDYNTFHKGFGRITSDCVPLMFGPLFPPGYLTPEVIAEIGNHKEQAFRDIIAKDVPLAPGILELLEELSSAGVRMAVGSSGPPENVNLVLDAGRIRRFFGAVITGADVKIGKPAPDVFLAGAAALGVPPAHAAVIEDAPAGIAAAVAARMLPVALTTTNTPEALRAAGARLLFPSIQSLRHGVLLDLITAPRNP